MMNKIHSKIRVTSTDLLVAAFLVMAIISFVSMSYNTMNYSEREVFFYIASSAALLTLLYIVKSNYDNKKNKVDKKKILIVGAGDSGKQLAIKLQDENSKYEVIGFVDDFKEAALNVVGNIKVLGTINDSDWIANNYNIEEVVISINNIDYERLFNIIDFLKNNKLKVKVSSKLTKIIENKAKTDLLEDVKVVNLNTPEPLKKIMPLKRFMDIILSSMGMIILSPIFFSIILIIKLTSKGPAIFKQIRIGKNGVPFKFYKFRSMTVINGEDEERKQMMIDFIKQNKNQTNFDTKIINEKRVTTIGKILRKTSLDELPQLFNVLKGDMSLVGPRPCLPYEFESYDDWQKKRLEVLPGCTGVWQTSGRSSVNFTDSIVLDLYYVNKMSPWYDLVLIFKTIPVMFFSKGGK